MKIIAHRGFMRGPDKGGTSQLIDALNSGFGVEFDIRDGQSGLALAHDPWHACADSLPDFLCKIPPDGVLAINIKSCGLAARLKGELTTSKINLDRCFCFDMAIPDHLHYTRIGLPVYARLSEFEPMTPIVNDADGVWLDSFHGQWWEDHLITDLLSSGKSVCLVSPELHRRDYTPLWTQIKEKGHHQHEKFMLCTDFAIKAQEFFV